MRDGDERFVAAFQAVGDDDMAARRIRREAIEICRFDMIERIFAMADVQRVAVRQERLAAKLLDFVRDDAREIRAEEGKIARFAEVDFNGGEFAVEINLVHARRLQQVGQLAHQAFAEGLGAHVREIDFRFRHDALLNIVAL